MSMSLNLAAYEEACRKQREKNEGYLAEFEETLERSGASVKAIRRHLRNVRVFLNEYLIAEETNDLEMGCYLVDDYMEGFFIEHCSWSSPATIEQSGTSFQKFYQCMLEHGHVDEDAYDELLATIDAQLPAWQEDCQKLSTPSPTQDAIHEAVSQKLGLQLGSLGTPQQSPSRQEAIDLLSHALLYLTALEHGNDPTASLSPHGLARAQEALDVFGLAHLEPSSP